MYKEVTLDEAVALAKAGATIYQAGPVGIIHRSYYWKRFSVGRRSLSGIPYSVLKDLYVKVEDDG